MKYNAKYDRWVSKDGLVYRYDRKNDKLVLCSNMSDQNGYIKNRVKYGKGKSGYVRQHRIVYETFVGLIPEGYEIDHINTIRDDNRVSNLRLVTRKENMNNPLTIKKIKGNTRRRNKAFSEFGRKYKEHFGIGSYENRRQYNTECEWYRKHNKVCRWEVEQ